MNHLIELNLNEIMDDQSGQFLIKVAPSRLIFYAKYRQQKEDLGKNKRARAKSK